MGINSTGYITGKKSGVFAYLSSAADTNIAVIDTWYSISGTFVNNPIENFDTNTVIVTPGIRYIGTKTQCFEIDFHITCEFDSNGTSICVGVSKNGTVFQECDMCTFLKKRGEPQAFSGTCVLELSENDEIQLVVKASKTGNITIRNFTTTISEFFD